MAGGRCSETTRSSAPSDIRVVPGFEGRVNPLLPTTFVIFPTFKRRRGSSILSDLEVSKKIFLIGRPASEERKWRERALRIINYDLIDPNTGDVLPVPTLSPHACMQILDTLLRQGKIKGYGNVLLAAHGSKMQTVGVWRFCEVEREVRIVMSRPQTYFVDKYSSGYGDTFVFDTASHWPKRIDAETDDYHEKQR